MTQHYPDGPRLVVQVGATTASFGLAYARGRVAWVRALPCAEYAQCAHAAMDYLYMCQCDQVRSVVVALDPWADQRWSASLEDMRQQLKLDTLLVLGAGLAAPVMYSAAAQLDALLAPRPTSHRMRRYWHSGRRPNPIRNIHVSE